MLITFSGIDGAGKSTVAHQLQSLLLSRHQRPSSYIWCKFGEHPLMFLMKGRKKGESSALKGYTVKSNRFSRKLYLGALLFFHIVKIVFSVLIPIRLGKIVLCDRYIYDTMVDLAQQSPFAITQTKRWFANGFIPQPDFHFLLDINEEKAFQRKTDTASLKFLSERKDLYFQVADLFQLEVIDTNQPPGVVVEHIYNKVARSPFLEKA